MKRIHVILNAGSGSGSAEAAAEEVRSLFVAAGAPAQVHLVRDGNEIARAVGAARDDQAGVIVAAGGDGTVNAVAALLVDTSLVLGVLPLGTLNHFARDVGVPLELEGAVRQVVEGEAFRVDVGEVNGRIFLNNSGLGLYADVVRHRDRQQKRVGRGKWHALLWASLAALRRFPFLDVALSVDGRSYRRRTPFVFVGNNAYRIEGFAVGSRDTLTGGTLSLYVAQRPGRWRLVQLALRALLGQLRQARDFDALTAAEITVQSRRRHLHVSTDGEVTTMAPPLRYRIRPRSLLVLGRSPAAEG